MAGPELGRPFSHWAETQASSSPGGPPSSGGQRRLEAMVPARRRWAPRSGPLGPSLPPALSQPCHAGWPGPHRSPLCSGRGNPGLRGAASHLSLQSARAHTPSLAAWGPPGTRSRAFLEPAPSLYDQFTLPPVLAPRAGSERSHEAHTAALDAGTHVSPSPWIPVPQAPSCFVPLPRVSPPV